MIDHLWPKLVGRQWWSASLSRWQFWLITIGLGAMFLTLTAGGIAEGFMAMQLSPRESILEMLRPFWVVRVITGVAIIAGFTCLLVNMAMTAWVAKAKHVDTDYEPYEPIQEEVTVGTV